MTNNQVRLQKYLSRCGIASRRKCETLIANGQVCVNDKVQTKLGFKINPAKDIVKFNGKVLHIQDNVTIMLNKPAGYVSTMYDPQHRASICDLIPLNKYPSIFPVGRLDRLTTGMLIFTSDGYLGQKLLHPSYETNKTYNVIIKGKLLKNSKAYKLLSSGMQILGHNITPAKIHINNYLSFSEYQVLENNFFENCANKNDQDCLPCTSQLINSIFTNLNITIYEGKNRQIRRMFSAVSYEVLLLKREKIGNLALNNLEYGKWRKLKDEEINLMLCIK